VCVCECSLALMARALRAIKCCAREMRKIFNVFFLSFRTPLGYLGFWKEKRAQPRKSEKGEGTDNALIKVQVGR